MKPFCQYCFNDPVTHLQQKEICGTCEMETKVAKRKITNADRIRSMTDEELAVFLDAIVHDWCEGTATINGVEPTIIHSWLDWLRQEVDE